MTYDLLAEITQDTRLKRTSSSRGGQYNGPCPWCGGTDRFRVQPYYGRYGFFACNQCRRSGSCHRLPDAQARLFQAACSCNGRMGAAGWQEPLGEYSITQHDRATLVGRNRRSSGNALRLPFTRPASAPCGRKLVILPWTTCRRRGLSDETIRKAALGYHPGPFRAPASQWGRTTWLAQGIVIPWLIEGGIWRLTIRDDRVTVGNRRYLQVKGGSNGLYLAQSLLLKRQAVVLLEGEFDALSIAQECGDLVAVVATGTTKGSHTPRWVSLLAQQQRVLVAFDAERDKGDADAQWWTRRLGNAQRLRPLWNDANQMLQDGVNLREWVSAALEKPATSVEKLPCESPGVSNRGPMETQPTSLTQHVYSPALSSVAGPHARCPFVYTVADRKGHIKGIPCLGEPLAGSVWCAEHQQAQTLLDLGAQLGYPRTQLTRHRSIGLGRGSWEAYACRAPAKWLCHDLLVIRP